MFLLLLGNQSPSRPWGTNSLYSNIAFGVPARIRSCRESIIELLMDGLSPEQAFSMALDNDV